MFRTSPGRAFENCPSGFQNKDLKLFCNVFGESIYFSFISYSLFAPFFYIISSVVEKEKRKGRMEQLSSEGEKSKESKDRDNKKKKEKKEEKPIEEKYCRPGQLVLFSGRETSAIHLSLQLCFLTTFLLFFLFLLYCSIMLSVCLPQLLCIDPIDLGSVS